MGNNELRRVPQSD